jgi:hypothetical protein
MNCDEYQQLASDFIDDELDPKEIRDLFSHLGSCDICWTYYRRVERLHTEMSRQKSVPVPHRRTPATVLLGGYVAFVVGILLTLLLLPPAGSTQPSTAEGWPTFHYHGASGSTSTGPGTEHAQPRKNP